MLKNGCVPDVESGRFYYKDVLWVSAKGITDTTFEPNTDVTRQGAPQKTPAARSAAGVAFLM